MQRYFISLLIFFIIMGIIRSKRSPPPAGRARTTTRADGELTWRALFLTLFLIPEYSLLVALGTFALLPAATGIKPEWLREAIVIAAAAGAAFLILLRSCPWLAWRVFRPLGFFSFARRLYWFTPGATRRDLENFEALLLASRGVPPAPPPPAKNGLREKVLRFLLVDKRPLPFLVDAKTTLMLALAKEVQGDRDRAERLLQTFELCPPGLKGLGVFRPFVFEELAWHAATRGDWNAVYRRARMGSGRGMLLMRLLAEKHSGRRVHWAALWFALLISPSRRRALRLFSDAQNGVSGEFTRLSGSTASSLRLTHMSILFKASEGITIEIAEVFRLAGSWADEFNRRQKDMLLRRGMELGARDVFGLVQKIEDSVLDELEEMAAVAEGEIPEKVLAGIHEDPASYEGRLFSRLRTRLYSDIDGLLCLFRVETDERVKEANLLERWENWLSLRESVLRFHRLLGKDELSTLWYGTLRNAVWNSITRIFNDHRYQVAFISMIMFNWVAETCRYLGDDEGTAANRNNTKLCRDELVMKPRVLKQISKWAEA